MWLSSIESHLRTSRNGQNRLLSKVLESRLLIYFLHSACSQMDHIIHCNEYNNWISRNLCAFKQNTAFYCFNCLTMLFSFAFFRRFPKKLRNFCTNNYLHVQFGIPKTKYHLNKPWKCETKQICVEWPNKKKLNVVPHSDEVPVYGHSCWHCTCQHWPLSDCYYVLTGLCSPYQKKETLIIQRLQSIVMLNLIKACNRDHSIATC